mmetsp:Transcript_19111/g.19243  ORF Transcript_19111/g.19243 Transcript_19111/m.19243 type:complete len:230 (-) Transcript_19111:141-830(-)|eukprot:CAMPEP_0182425522 /NCGR_PEP_ID=MMETSP1167-20130531/11976_1 /TAXON_ID=2988 /ORGANISM="Mallomonas Sp, Strain CCMP3275" /LENGTH=229 /DNA_ID=CAMNT_0024606323 /DNA_START=325 /DNA_END=1014 /DNA_ORIENTATION=-
MSSKYDDDDDEKFSKRDEDKPRGTRGRRVRQDEPADEISLGLKNTELRSEKEDTGGPGGRGRRRRAGDDAGQDEGFTSAPKSQSGGGWMDMSAPKAAQNDEQIESLQDTQNETSSKHFGRDTGDDEILVIPDLDEEAGTDADHRVAHAPRNLSRKVPTRLELEDDVKASLPSVEGGFDLAVLLGTLVPHELVREEDVSWTFDSLLRDVTEEINSSKELAAQKKGDHAKL